MTGDRPSPTASRRLGTTGLVVSRLGVGLAAVGRPGYITLGRARDLPAERSPEAMYARSAEILDGAWAAGVRYFDVARSYGRAEEFLARWLGARAIAPGAVTVGSKWGYRYTAGWSVDAAVHEQKELSVDRFTEQLAESRRQLGRQLDLYQIHSATAESGCLGDTALLGALVDGKRGGAYRAVGLTLSGATSAWTLEQALAATVDGERVFDTVQATFNCLEPSLAPLLAAAHEAGMGVIAKEVHANGRLTDANGRPEDTALLARLRVVGREVGAKSRVPDVATVALAFVLAYPFVDVALSGAATIAHLESHLAALSLPDQPELPARLADVAETPKAYWATRASLPWS